jgi:pimeloyl-ACP methyl ester carboxylesterase
MREPGLQTATREQLPLGQPGAEARRRLIANLPVVERRIELAGISTAVLEGGDGPPVILLHGPSGYAAHWMAVLPGLTTRCQVVAPDLPGHGASEVADGALDAARVLAWLGELIEKTCKSPPALVGQLIGGAIAARFAADNGNRISRLVLIDSLGFRAFQPAPNFGQALGAFLADPNERTHQHLWQYCAFDLDRLRKRMAGMWEPFEAYNLERARSPAVQRAVSALMGEFGMPAIPETVLARIAVPTTLIWGRHDLATPLVVAEAVGARFDWPLRVIENCADDPPVERPEVLLRELLAAIGAKGKERTDR